MHRSTPLPFPLPRLPLRRWWRRARRSPLAWWTAAVLTAGLAATQLATIDDEADARRRSWGDQRSVVVAVHDLAPGDVVEPGDVTVEQWPVAVVPESALDAVPEGRVVTGTVVAGEAVVDQRLAPGGLAGVAALVPPGQRAIAVPVAAGGYGTEAPPVSRGDRVDVLATFDVLDGEAPPTAPVAREAVVVDVGDASVTVAVPEADASRVAFAVARGTVSLALVGAG